MNNVYNLKRELEIENLILNRLYKQRRHILARQSPKGYPEGQSYQDADSIPGRGIMSFINAVTIVDKLDAEIQEKEIYIQVLEAEINRITKLVDSLTGLEQKVKYMQLVEGKSLKEIAIETGYSYDHIRRVSSRMPH